MPAYFWIHLYTQRGNSEPLDLVQRTVQAITRWGAVYLEARANLCENPRSDPGQRRYRHEVRSVPIAEGERLLAHDLGEWVSGAWNTKWGGDKDLPEVQLVFRCPFEFDEPRGSDVIPDEARELKVCFWYERNLDRILIDIDVWEEFVLMYGRDSTHAKNLRRILDLIAVVYDDVSPTYGWADKEIDSVDKSYERISKGELEPRNFCVVIGQPLIQQFKRSQFRDTAYVLRPLADGGLMVISPAAEEEEIWKWEGDPKAGKWVPFHGRFGARLSLD